MRQSHLTITFTPRAAERAGLRLDEMSLQGMEDVLDLIERYDLIGQIEHRQLIIRARGETVVKAEAAFASER